VLGAPLAELPGANAKLRRHLRQPLAAVQQPLHRLFLELPREAPSGSPLRHPSLLGCLGSLANPPASGGKSNPINPGTGCAPLPPECPFERGDVDVMQQCREPCSTRSSGRLIHTPEVRQQGLPAQCPALRLFRRDPVLPPPFLHHLVSFGDFIDTMERSDSHPRCGVLWLSLVRRPRR